MEEIITTQQMKDAIPKWLVGFIGSLMGLSLFINSIGFNLMSVNGALTEYVVSSIAHRERADIAPELIGRIKHLEKEIAKLKILSHQASRKH